MYLRVIVALIGGRVSTKKVKVPLVVHIPDKHTLSLVQDDRNGSIVVGAVLVFPFNELQRNGRCRPIPELSSPFKQRDRESLHFAAEKKMPEHPQQNGGC